MGPTARSKRAVSEKLGEPTRQPPADGTKSGATLTEDAVTSEVAAETVTSSEEITSSASEEPTAQQADTAATDGSIITKDISPTARVPTTYGRENRVGHRYLRKSLNSTRGQSDTDAGDGPPRSPKIRIEARIDSDKKSEQLAREEHQVRNTRVRRNLRYAEKNTEAEEEVVEAAKNATKVRNKRRAKLPTPSVDDDPESNSKTNCNAGAHSQAAATRSASSPAKRQTKESSKQQTVEQSAAKTDKTHKTEKAKKTNPGRPQPKEQIRTRAREQEKERASSANPTKLLVRAATRNAGKNNGIEEVTNDTYNGIIELSYIELSH